MTSPKPHDDDGDSHSCTGVLCCSFGSILAPCPNTGVVGASCPSQHSTSRPAGHGGWLVNIPASVPATDRARPCGACQSPSGDGGPELAGRWQIPARGRIWSRASSPPANERGAETSNSAAGLAAPSLAREDLRPWPGWGVACQAASCWRPPSAEQDRDAAAIFGKILSRPFRRLFFSLSLSFLLMRWPPATPAAAQ